MLAFAEIVKLHLKHCTVVVSGFCMNLFLLTSFAWVLAVLILIGNSFFTSLRGILTTSFLFSFLGDPMTFCWLKEDVGLAKVAILFLCFDSFQVIFLEVSFSKFTFITF